MKNLFRRLIVGGFVTSIDNAPYLVRIHSAAQGSGFCGGTLIGSKTVLTAAHCLYGILSNPPLYIGTYHNTIWAEDNEIVLDEVIVSDSFVVHPNYDDDNIQNGYDIAIINLNNKPYHLNKPDGPFAISLDDGSYWSSEGGPMKSGYIVGYGKTFTANYSIPPRAAYVNLYSDAECVEKLGNKGYVTGGSRCAGLDESDSCQGDSGGPLIVSHDGMYIQTGIVSYGWGCGVIGSPGVYATISSYKDFITSNSQDVVFSSYNNNSVANPCSCTINCKSNGFSVAPRCNCSVHDGDELYCYVNDDKCSEAQPSSYVFGAYYLIGCNVSSSPSPPPSPSQTTTDFMDIVIIIVSIVLILFMTARSIFIYTSQKRVKITVKENEETTDVTTQISRSTQSIKNKEYNKPVLVFKK